MQNTILVKGVKKSYGDLHVIKNLDCISDLQNIILNEYLLSPFIDTLNFIFKLRRQ